MPTTVLDKGYCLRFLTNKLQSASTLYHQLQVQRIEQLFWLQHQKQHHQHHHHQHHHHQQQHHHHEHHHRHHHHHRRITKVLLPS
eukprot:360911-Amphidinium_carterae.3